MITRAQLESEWSNAATSGTLLTTKHDPNGIDTPLASYRTVLTPQLSASLEAFVKSGQYSINHYKDQRYPSGPGLFEVIPNSSAGFSVVGSGVPSGSLHPSGSLDRLVFVSGSNQGWHVYADSTQEIATKVASGRLQMSRSL
jgi:hypothetical protein